METNDLNRTAPEGQFSDTAENTTVTTAPAAQECACQSQTTAGEPLSEDADKALTPEKLADKSKNEILAIFADLLETKPARELRKEVEAIKIAFYKAHKAESAAHRDAYLAEGGDPDAYKPVVDDSENRLKELIAVYRDRRDTYLKELDSALDKNLKDKQQIIEELKELIAGSEIMGSTFNAFRELQRRWRESGPVPASHSKDIWETYHLHVEKFYDYIKINKELRDLDLKKNYETKLALCEEAESLLVNESSVIEAFHRLQKLHEQWRECGPVGAEYKDVLWERFKEASTKINKAHQEHFDAIKEEQQRNLNLKNELCTKAEELTAMPRDTRSDWDKASEELIEIQKVWKTIGFAPKRDNTRIYERFRAACDTFFDKKREFFLTMKDEMENNMQAKIALCIAAEGLAQSSDWKKSTDELIALQAEWKKIGAVSRKQSDAVWKRFRAACDTFFNRKSEHYAGLEGQYTDNLNAKKALIEEIRAYSPADSDSPLDKLKEFQRRWTEIGFVPVKEKDALYTEYRNLIDARFAEIRGGEKERRMEKFKARLKDGDDRHVRSERDKLHARLRQIESDITLLENNIGFFAKSKNAEAMVEDVRRKIAKSKEEMQVIIEKIKIIDTENKKQQEENDKK